MALSYVRGCLKSIVVPLAVVLLMVGLGWAAPRFFFGPHVSRVDPAVLSELRAIGRVVGEDASVGHAWENTYVEMNDLVVFLDGNAKEDVVTEVERRLKQRGWHISRREPPEIWLESARWPSALVTVERLEETHMSSELRVQVTGAGLPVKNMAYIGVQP
ncbi:hypothetical protein AB0L65_60290 [Nonomuraea sp. NPDC052116]|uniref:hypothetical protein n=1 Tax=Nonomuraea sp. NPDC052116 TaxID=3155665 RepID=UPI00341C1CC1